MKYLVVLPKIVVSYIGYHGTNVGHAATINKCNIWS